MTPVLFHSKALAELDEVVLYLNQQQPDLGDEFLDSVEQSIDIIARFPDTWPCVRKDLRRILVPRFHYSIFYRLTRHDTIEIIAVMHPKRRPFNFRDRL